MRYAATTTEELSPGPKHPTTTKHTTISNARIPAPTTPELSVLSVTIIRHTGLICRTNPSKKRVGG